MERKKESGDGFCHMGPRRLRKGTPSDAATDSARLLHRPMAASQIGSFGYKFEKHK
jgi:hypothetical protein